jgi:hypothetical protein
LFGLITTILRTEQYKRELVLRCATFGVGTAYHRFYKKHYKKKSDLQGMFTEYQKTYPVPQEQPDAKIGSKQEPYFDHEWKYGTFIPFYKYEDVIKEK